MSILDRRHVREETLAALASEEQAPADLSPSDRQHLEMCDRCSGLVEGHRLATRALAAPWQFVTAGEVSTGRGVERVRGRVSGGLAGQGRLSLPMAVALAILLLSAVIGAGIFVGASRPSLVSPPAVYAGPNEAASPSLSVGPSQSPIPSVGPYVVDTSTWSGFVSARHGYTISVPPLWTVIPARTPWNPAVYQGPAFDTATDAFMHPDAAATRGSAVAVYGIALPKGMTYAAFIEKYLAPKRAWLDVGCVARPDVEESITIDGHEAGRATGCGFQQATLLADGRVYVFETFGDMSNDRARFDAFLSTVHLHPETADDSPVAP